MKRPSGTALAIVGGALAFITFEMIVWWPDPPKKPRDEVHSEASVPHAYAIEPRLSPSAETPAPIASPRNQARDIPRLRADESDEIRRLEGCGDKRCGDPCVFRCDERQDSRCIGGVRPGACTAEGTCSYVLPAICTGQAEPTETP